MIWADLIAFLNDFEPGFGEATLHVGRMVHLTVAVRDASEVQRGLLQAEGGGFIGLTVPEEFKNVQICPWSHRCGCALENGNDLALGKAIEELAHPDGILILGKGGRAVQNVYREKSNAVFKAVQVNGFAGKLQLSRQICNRDVDLGIKFQALQGPFAGVSAEVKQLPWALRKDDW